MNKKNILYPWQVPGTQELLHLIFTINLQDSCYYSNFMDEQAEAE